MIYCYIFMSDISSDRCFSLPFLWLDRRTDDWLLVYSPVPIACIFLCYLFIIWVGPKLMSKRQPVNLKPVLIVYNFAMVCLSAYMFYEVGLLLSYKWEMCNWCYTGQQGGWMLKQLKWGQCRIGCRGVGFLLGEWPIWFFGPILILGR